MIGEKKFIHDFNTFWNSVAPMMQQYVVNVNKYQIRNYTSPTWLTETPGDRGLVNETAYEMCVEVFNGTLTGEQLFNRALEKARKKISNLENEEVDTNINRKEVELLYQSLFNFIKDESFSFTHKITFSPYFKGCGFLSPCEGDFIIGNSLYEVKAGDRNFKGIDFRQVLIYSALNYLNVSKLFDYVTLVNPRRGTVFCTSLEDLSFSVSGLSARDLIQQIQGFLLGGELSK